MSEWTKGPWAWTHPNQITSGLSGADGKPVIDDLGYDGLYINPKSADARLIAAAPTMAEALENLLAHTEGVTLPAAAHVMREKARAALALAKGEDRNG